MGSKEKKLALPISELVRQLEEQITDPNTLDKTTLKECAVFLRNKGYSSPEIARVLKVNERTIQRYMKMYRSEIKLELGEHFQLDFVGEIVNSMRLRCQRLWRLVYSGTLSVSEEARAICAIHQIEMDKLLMLERLGYIQESQGKQETSTAYEFSIEKRGQEEVMKMLWIHDKRLTLQQVDFLKNEYICQMRFYPHKVKEIPKRINLIIDMFIEENEFLRKRESANSNTVTVSSQLYCKVFVINKLCNN